MEERKMNQTNSLAEIQSKYKDCNILMPVSTEVQLNPFYKYTVMEVTADTSENSGDIFKVGSTKIGNNYEDVFSPAKPLLMKLASAAGIQFDPNNTYGSYLSKNCYKAKAYGAMRMPDGTGKTHCDEKVINLDDEEDNFRLEFMDKSLQGITDKKAGEAAAKLFKGEWIDSADKWGKACKAYKIADEDRQKYIDRSVLVNMTLLRKTFAEKAMTGAILRVVRALIGMKGTYSKKELTKPFAIPRVTFSPDYSDPEVRRAMLDQGLSSVSNMFGSNRVLPATTQKIDTPLVAAEFNPDEYIDNAAFASSSDGEIPNVDLPKPNQNNTDSEEPLPWEQQEQPDTNEEDPDPNICSNCRKAVSDKVAAFSIKQFGRPLCMDCQKGAH
jgi:hypothetical protein